MKLLMLLFLCAFVCQILFTELIIKMLINTISCEEGANVSANTIIQ